MAKRSFLMLAHKYEPKKHNVKGFYVSEKLDGMRAYWDGGITRGMPSRNVPFANVEKDSRYVKEMVSTGLWSRYGKTIQAPNWWLDKLPKIPLDGELYCGVGSFQRLVSITKQLNPVDADWECVEYRIFDSPAPYIIYGNGVIEETNIKKKFVDVERTLGIADNFIPARTFSESYKYLQSFPQNSVYRVHKQTELEAVELLELMLEKVTSRDGEGLMLRDPNSIWLPQRSHSLLKVKGVQDAEGTIVGYVWGRETDKGSKLLGMMGAMVVKLDNGIVFELSGFTDAERQMMVECYDSPGEKVPDHIESKFFRRGERVTFKYRELTRDGVPKEARFWRKYPV